MDSRKYQEQALATAIYPNKGKNLAYSVLGLNEESGEAFEKHQLRQTELFLKELGDVLWYVNATAFEIGSSLSDVFEHPSELLEDSDTDELLIYLFSQSAIISGRAKKVIRDNNGTITADKKLVIVQSLSNIISALILISKNVGSSLQEIADLNISKLQGRKSSGTLNGDGDVR